MERILHDSPRLRWIDISRPSHEELTRLAEIHHLDPTSVEDCLDPRHLPKCEKTEQELFIIIRVIDLHAPENASTAQELTRKIAVFIKDSTLITVHRSEQPLLERLARECGVPPSGAPAAGTSSGTATVSADTILIRLLRLVLFSYDDPLAKADAALDRFEEVLSQGEMSPAALQQIHNARRRLSAVKRLLWHTMAVIQQLSPHAGTLKAQFHQFQDLREHCQHVQFFADELLEDITSLLNLQISLASHRTNEVVRVLTLFSVFFMPLTFIVGIYGMNFHQMPELGWRFGYPAAWGLILLITAAIAWWFRRKGWLK